jgi:hypothetical protein
MQLVAINPPLSDPLLTLAPLTVSQLQLRRPLDFSAKLGLIPLLLSSHHFLPLGIHRNRPTRIDIYIKNPFPLWITSTRS